MKTNLFPIDFKSPLGGFRGLFRRLLLSTCFLMFAVPLLANDVITFKWTADGSKDFTIRATLGKKFMVDWGDGKSYTYTGYYPSTTPSYTYASSGTYTVTITSTVSDCFLNALNLYNSSVTAVDVTGAPALTMLEVHYNQLTALDISKNTKLNRLACHNNALSLADLYAASEHISKVDRKYLGTQTLPAVKVKLNTPVSVTTDLVLGGKNTTFMVTKNGSAAVEGDDYTRSAGSFTFLTDGIYRIEITNPAIISSSAHPARVKATYVAGTPANQQINFSWTADGSKKFIIRATSGKEFTVDWGDGQFNIYVGVGNMPMHTYAEPGNYKVTVSGVTVDCSLTELNLYDSSVTAIDVTGAPALTALICNNNQLTSLDVSKNTALISLWCYENQLSSLDVSKNTALTSLWCSYNQLTALDVSKNTVLTDLSCDNNQFTTLDVSKNTKLTSLNCHENQLTALDVSRNTALTSLSCSYNQFTALDVSKNMALTDLFCGWNDLTALDVSKNMALTLLSCGWNDLTELDVSKNMALTLLSCGWNDLTELDVSKNTKLTSLNCYYNQLTALDISKNTKLIYLDFQGNQLTELDVSKNIALSGLICNENQLTALDLSKNTMLTLLWCYNNAIPLTDVYAASERISNVSRKYLGTQTLPAVKVALNTPVPVDTVFNGEGTVFVVSKQGGMAIENTDYARSGGNITFLIPGDYTVTTSNLAITSYNYYPAKVVSTYHVVISDDATLRSLTVSRGALTPAFSANVTHYTVDVAYSVTFLTIGATANHAAATVTGDVGVQSLEAGENIFTITVTAEDGITTETYTIIINRATTASTDATLSALTLSEGTLMPEFVPDITNYTAEVRNSVTGVVIGATANHAAATVTGDTGMQSLKIGNNTFTITVTAEDGTTTQDYTITVVRAASADAMLSALTISGGALTPVFAPDITAYTVKVKNSVTGVAIAAIAHHAVATVTGDVRVQSLKVGENIFTITVTAEDGVTTKDYTIIVTRAAWDIPYIESLTVSGGDLSPTFASRVTDYTVNMLCGTNSLSLAATSVSGATVEYLMNNTPATMPLSVTTPGITTVIIRVAAIEGSATQDYRVTVIRPFASTILRQYWDDVLAVNLNTATNGGYTFTGYQWYRNGQPITGATEAYLYLNGSAFSSTDTYTVHLTTGGITLAACPLQVSPKKAQATVTAYPNPATTHITIDNAQWENIKQIDLIDMNGRLVNSYPSEGVQTTINVGDFQTGIYLLRVGNQTISILIE